MAVHEEEATEEAPPVVLAEPLLPATDNNDNVQEQQEQDEESSSSCCFSLVWILLLCWIIWPVAFLAANLWIFLQPFEAIVDVVQIANRFLEQFVTWPRACGQGTYASCCVVCCT